MILLKSSQNNREISLSEAFRLAPGEPILRFRASFQMGSLPYVTTWVTHIHPVDLVEYFHRVVRLVRDPKTAHQEMTSEDLAWRSAEGHLLFRAMDEDNGGVRLDCTICTVPRRDPIGTSMTIHASDAALTAFLTDLAHFFSVDLPGNVMLPQEDWDDWGGSSPGEPLAQDQATSQGLDKEAASDEPVRGDVWFEGHTPSPASPSQVDLEGWEEE